MFKMALVCYLLALTLLNAFAAPTDNTQQVTTETTKTQDPPRKPVIQNERESPPVVRQKRLFNHYGFGLPPVSPIIYQNRRNGFPYAAYASADPLQQIYRHLQDLSNYSRQPYGGSPIQTFPFFFPVIFVPQAGCNCNNRPNQNGNNTFPGVDSRFPLIEDSRQNWGFIVDNNIVGPSFGTNDYDDDISRPISFDPVRPNRPLNRPTPPVEHGSSQAGAESQSPPQGSQVPPNAPLPPQAPQPTQPPQRPVRPQNVRPVTTTTTVAPSSVPSACDGAVLTCCHQPQITYDCFAAQGCPDPNSYGVPCDANVILRVIEKFQRFYGQRT